MQVGVILATLLLLVVLFLIIRLILGPLKILTKFFFNCGIALFTLVVLNFIGQYVGYHLPINPVSVMGLGFLGVPGLILVTFLNYLLG